MSAYCPDACLGVSVLHPEHKNRDLPCLIAFPEGTSFDKPCARCGENAGDHPAPLILLDDQETTIFNRPTLREAITAKEAQR